MWDAARALAPWVTVAASGFALGVLVGRRRGFPFVRTLQGWSVGIYEGASPLRLSPAKGVKQPVLKAEDIGDVDAEFVADPFLTRVGDDWHMFVEVWNRRTMKGEIGLAMSRDARSWAWKGVVLTEPFHLSYPQVFEWGGAHWMLPESHRANAVRLYRATSFPTSWEHVKDLLPGCYSDPTVVRHEGRWYMFVETWYGILRLFVADDLLGPWREHPKSPIYFGAVQRARCGGRITVHEGGLYRYGQDGEVRYGNMLRAFEVTTLTPTEFAEIQCAASPVLRGTGRSRGWNALGMHHCDAHRLADGTWIAAVDGFGDRFVFSRRW